MADFDLAVIGAGSAGLSVAAVAAQLGLRVALIERGEMGGECLNTGCVPSKALLAASHAALDASSAARFGVRLGPATIDWQAVRAHVAGVIAGIAPGDSQARFEGLGATVLRAQARFCAPDALMVGERRLSARKIVIACGSRPAIPDIPGLDAARYWTNETLFALAEQPAHLLILGGGAIGLEMAQAFRGLGSEVTLVEHGRIAAREDPDLADVVRQTLRGQGVVVREGARVAAVEPGPTLVLEGGARLTGTHLLVAVGRRPNIEGLDLGAGGVRATADGIATDAGLRSLTNRRVYAAGDIADPAGTGPRRFTHVASYHAGLIVRRALFRLPARLDDGAVPRVVYTDPELAQVGLTEAEARARGLKIRVLTWKLDENDRARAERATDGLAKIVVTPRGKILGAGIVSAHAGEMVGAWTLAIARKVPLSALAGMIVPYPTRAEALKRAAGSFYAPTLFSRAARRVAATLMHLP